MRDTKSQLNSDDLEKRLGENSHFTCLASVVGYREDPTVFAKCLESFKGCLGLHTLLVGIDGDQAQDIEVADIARTAYPGNVTFIHLDEPLAHLAERLLEEYVVREFKATGQSSDPPDDWTLNHLPRQLRQEATTHAMDQVYAKAAQILQEHEVLYSLQTSFRVICVTQPHVNKKGILFTNLVLSTIVGKVSYIPYLWTGDSDTWVTPDTLPLTIGCMAADPTVGGSCSLLGIHNQHESYSTLLLTRTSWLAFGLQRKYIIVLMMSRISLQGKGS